MDIERLKEQEPTFLREARKKVNGHVTYICPECGNGSGSSGDGIALDVKSAGEWKRWKCFKCGMNENIMGLWKLHKNTSDDKEAMKELVEYYGISDSSNNGSGKVTRAAGNNNKGNDKKAESAEADYTTEYKTWHKNVNRTTYFKDRGLSEEVIEKYNLGYSESFPGRPGRTWKAAIIPTAKGSYSARNTDKEASSEERFKKTGEVQPYPKELLWDNEEPVFIVEGEMDALSIIEAGKKSVSLGGTSGVNKLLDLLAEKAPTGPLIIALDNDTAGQETANKLSLGLIEIRIPHIIAKGIYGDKKDANEALLANREGFISRLETHCEEAAAHANDIIEKASAEEREDYYTGARVSNLMGAFLEGIDERAGVSATPTGFMQLDEQLGGGLYEGLYIIGAISSLGKTTFIMQIADQIAQQGQDVLIMSLEMSKFELMSKSISRETFIEALDNNISESNAKTCRGITETSRWKYYNEFETALIQKAMGKYFQYGEHIFMNEGIGEIGAAEVREATEKHIKLTGNKPVVIVDYLQILAPYNDRASDKQNTDRAVLELKRISRDYKIPVIAISSFNRASYSLAVTMEAFKESGAIEYSSDVLMGLQLKGAGSTDFDVNKAKQQDPREIELKILKNRNGATGKSVFYEYKPMFNHFKEYEPEPEEDYSDWVTV